jgi:transposase
VNDRTGLSSGDRNRNARLARVAELLPLGNAIVGIDLAGDKQAAVVTDHDSRLLARRRVTARAWELGELLDWAVVRAKAAGFASVTVACEPTGTGGRCWTSSPRSGVWRWCVCGRCWSTGPRRRGPDLR